MSFLPISLPSLSNPDTPGRRHYFHSKTWLIGGLTLWLVMWAGLLQMQPTPGKLEFELTSQLLQPHQARLYFDRGSGLNDADSVTAWLRPDGRTLHFNLPAGEIHLFRLDPLTGSTPFRITAIQARPSHLSAAQQIPLSRVRTDGQTSQLELTPQGLHVYREPGAAHPQLVIEPISPLEVLPSRSPLLSTGISAALLVLIIMAAWRFAPCWTRSAQTAVVSGLAAAFVLAWTMACLSPSGDIALHPDEFAHVWCFQFYLDHLWPVAADHPALIPTISVYGFSYLFELDVVYMLAARTVGVFSGWFANDVLSARGFNLALLLGVTCLAVFKRRWAPGLSVLLLSPQIWYLFSYFNADALPLALSVVAACAAADRDSGLNRYLDGRSRFGAAALLFTLAVGLLLISKRTFLPVIPVLGLWLAIHHVGMRTREVGAMLTGLLLLGTATHLQSLPGWPGTTTQMLTILIGLILVAGGGALVLRESWLDPERRPRLLRLIAVFGLACVIVSPWLFMDIALNGTPGQKAATFEQIAETHAGHGFKPSHLDQDFAYAGRAVAQRGTSLAEVAFAPHEWLAMSLETGFGVYGYLSVAPASWLLRALQLIFLVVVLLAAAAVFRGNRRQAAPLLLVLVGGCVLVLANSLLHSWVTDLQRQGRYLFPIFAMLSLAMAYVASQRQRQLLGALVASAFILGCISFAGTALPALAGGS